LLTQEIVDERLVRGFQGTHAVVVDRQIAVTNQDRIAWSDATGAVQYLDIVGYHNPEQIGELPVVDCLAKF
jgi:hypothetical protein